MTENLIKSSARKDKFGEVYTPKEVVKQMCNEVGDIMYETKSTVIEPACGNGNFLVEVVERKMQGLFNRYDYRIRGGENGKEYNPILNEELNFDILRAVSSIYGIDIQYDNVIESRERMLDVVKDWYSQMVGKNMGKSMIDSVNFILEHNIIHGDFIGCNMWRHESSGVEQDNLSVIEWTFIDTKNVYTRTVKMEEFKMADLQAGLNLICRESDTVNISDIAKLTLSSNGDDEEMYDI